MYVELDCLLDTRLATLYVMGEQYCDRAFKAKYHERISDLLPGISYEEFSAAYAKRNKQTLKHAMMTPVGVMMRDFAQKTTENTLNSPHHHVPKIVLNVYPYELDDDERMVLARTVRSITLSLADVEVIRREPKDVTPLYVKHNLTTLVMYRYDEWLELHCANGLFKKTSAPDVALLAPRVYFKKPDATPAPGEDPFRSMEEMASPLINLHLLPANVFSIIVNPSQTAKQA